MILFAAWIGVMPTTHITLADPGCRGGGGLNPLPSEIFESFVNLKMSMGFFGEPDPPVVFFWGGG